MKQVIITFFQTILLLSLLLTTILVSCASQTTMSTSPSQIVTSTPTPSVTLSQTPTAPPKPSVTPKEVELKYDDGTAECINSSVGGGYIVDFSPPENPFTVTKISVYGVIEGSATQPGFDLEILNKDLQPVHSVSYPQTKFTGVISWLEFPVPAINVNDKFYVHLYVQSNMSAGIKLGADSSIPNIHSNITSRSGGKTTIKADWPYQGGACAEKKNINWMIRVVGISQKLKVDSPK